MSLFGDVLPWFCVAYGKKFSGKSCLAKYLVWEYRNTFNYIVVFSASANANHGYDYLPSSFVHTKYDSDVMNKIIEKQEKLWAAGKKVQCLVILDDIIGMSGFDSKRPPPELERLYTQNRHYGISLFIATQSVRALPPVCRVNADFSCIFRQLNVSLETLYQEFSNMPKKEFYDFIHKYTNDFGIIIYNARERDNDKQFIVLRIPESELNRKFRLKY